MEIRILAIGDIVGRPGREAVAALLPQLREQYQPDLVIANAENATHGHGCNADHARYLVQKLQIDVLTMGDHVFNQDDTRSLLEDPSFPIVCPANFPSRVPGKRWVDVVVKGKRVRVINPIGRVFMGVGPHLESPFTAVETALNATPSPDVVVVDIHAEATSEKKALALAFDGRVSLVYGTHTHVPTADAQVLPAGTGYISDLGMVGPIDSCLGADAKPIISNFLTGLPWRYSVAVGRCELGACFCTVDVTANRVTSIEHIRQFH
jgi:metallophosphoesterase (TIGR00282 family)